MDKVSLYLGKAAELLKDMALDVANAESLVIHDVHFPDVSSMSSNLWHVAQMDAARSALHAVVGAAKYSELMIEAYLTLREKDSNNG